MTLRKRKWMREEIREVGWWEPDLLPNRNLTVWVFSVTLSTTTLLRSSVRVTTLFLLPFIDCIRTVITFSSCRQLQQMFHIQNNTSEYPSVDLSTLSLDL